MPDESTASTPSIEKAGEVFQLSKAELEQLLESNAEKVMKAVNEDREKLRAEAKAKETNPATRPSMAAVLEAGDPLTEKKGPGLEKKEIEEINRLRKFLPSGNVPKDADLSTPITADVFQKGVMQSSAPRGEVMDNFFVTRLAYATQQWAQGKAASISKYAP